MSIPIWLPFVIRPATTALLVVGAAAVAEAAGPFWGALIASLPVATGPAYIFLALQHPAAFVAAGALASCAANAACALFLLVYARTAAGRGPLAPIALAVLAWLAAALAIRQVAWTPLSAALLNLVAFLACLALVRGVSRLPAAPPRPGLRRHRDLPLRASAVAAFVTLAVAVGSVASPSVTGIVVVYPISLSCLLVILRPRIGGAAAALLAANALPPMLGFGLMLLALHLAIGPLGVPAAMAVALLVQAGWAGALMLWRRHSLARA